MTSLPQALTRIKANVASALPEAVVRSLVADLARPYNHRTLAPVVTTYLFRQQVLHGHTAASHLRHLAGLNFSDSAYCQARQRLPVAFFQRLHQAVLVPCRQRAARDPAARWHGHRVFVLDGSRFSRPDTPELREQFGQPSGQTPGCGFPTAHRLVPFDLQHGFWLRALAAPLRTHDLQHAAGMHRDLNRGDVLLGDRAFCSYAHLALGVGRGLHGLFRAHQKSIISFRPRRRHAGPGKVRPEQTGLPRSRWLKRLGKTDQLVESFKPAHKPDGMTAPE